MTAVVAQFGHFLVGASAFSGTGDIGIGNITARHAIVVFTSGPRLLTLNDDAFTTFTRELEWSVSLSSPISTHGTTMDTLWITAWVGSPTADHASDILHLDWGGLDVCALAVILDDATDVLWRGMGSGAGHPATVAIDSSGAGEFYIGGWAQHRDTASTGFSDTPAPWTPLAFVDSGEQFSLEVGYFVTTTATAGVQHFSNDTSVEHATGVLDLTQSVEPTDLVGAPRGTRVSFDL